MRCRARVRLPPADSRFRRKFAQLQAAHRAKKIEEKLKYGYTYTPSALSSSSKKVDVPKQPNEEEIKQETTVARKSSSTKTTPLLRNGERIDVFYGRTDNTTGYKEYSCVVVQTKEKTIQYYGDVYEPCECRYKVLYEVPMHALERLCAQEPATDYPPSRGWVTGALKEKVLHCWKSHNSER